MEILLFFILLLFCSTHLTRAKNILHPGESLYSDQSLVSKNGEFEFGFTSHTWEKDDYYIAIWFRDEKLRGEFVWVGNRENPVNISQPCALSMSHNGNLILIQSQKLIWSTNLTETQQVSRVIDLLDTGNLVLLEQLNSDKVVWQSFDHPTDTWLPGAWLGSSNINGNNITFSLTSWNAEYYTLERDPSLGNWGFILTQLTQVEDETRYHITLPSYIPIMENGHGLITIKNTTSPPFRVTLNVYGVISIWKGAVKLYSNPCDVYENSCGPFGLCISASLKYFSSCICPYGFQRNSSEDSTVENYSAGCARNYSWNCTTNSSLGSNKYTFHLLDNLESLPEDWTNKGVMSQKECELACLNYCNCTAYALNDAGHCIHRYGELLGITIRIDGLQGKSIYIRLAIFNSTSKRTDNKHMKFSFFFEETYEVDHRRGSVFCTCVFVISNDI
ncbi:hypothetical protein LUZ61_004808 [Rhynchospora tenuis]|uniref:non-specific serine/threonine protein kinase n=1 Tax=Rhynchospora tenuis TaxID=198213 RepID=A0AAD5ZNK6_9POAL|nr:hypothetical protein LUZ61_004808 [Rhynchospora tenuis]